MYIYNPGHQTAILAMSVPITDIFLQQTFRQASSANSVFGLDTWVVGLDTVPSIASLED